MLVAVSIAALISVSSGVHLTLPLVSPLYFYGAAQPFYGVLPVLPVNQAVASTYIAGTSREGGHPLREAVESQPSDAVKAQTRMVDFLTRGACEEGHYKPASVCQDYLFCVHGKYEQKSCQAGLFWDDNVKVCNFPDAVDCKEGARPDGVETAPEIAEAGIVPETAPVIAEVDDNPRPGDADFVDEAAVSSTTPATVSSTTEDWNKPWAPPTKPPRADYDNKPLTNGLSGAYKIVCYFTNWATYRQGGDGQFNPEHIDPNICTHIIYGFAVLDQNTMLVKSHDPYADMTDGYSGKDFYAKVTEFKKYGIKVTLALGGWNDSKGSKYSKLVNNPAARARFIEHVITFIEKHDFDGLDLDWEYPSCWQTDCMEENYKDKAAFTAWVSELRAAFNPKGLLLSAAVSPSKKIMDVGYDIPSIARDLDWINVMTYDYHGQWDKKTGHVAPFYGHPDDDYSYFNANFTMNYWIESGAPASKLVMGMPLYGQSFTLANKEENGLNAPAKSGGKAGPATRAKGFLAYHEICRNVASGWTVVKDDATPARMGPYAYNGDQWVGFDDKEMIRKKSEYVREMGLGGGMVWALDLDDFKNKCGEGRYPLMNTIREVLGPAK